MKERPILFSAPMINAIREGRKTQTRRVVKPQPHTTPIANGSASGNYDAWPNGDSCLEWDDVLADTAYYVQAGFCPHGQPGDRLWVRETWRADYEHGENTRGGVPPSVEYRADTNRYGPVDGSADAESVRWRPSIFMPRWASRITLEVVSVRVEQVQDISEEDAIAEGCIATAAGDGYPFAMPARMNFVDLWDDINAKRGFGWAVDPWVWVVEFKEIV